MATLAAEVCDAAAELTVRADEIDALCARRAAGSAAADHDEAQRTFQVCSSCRRPARSPSPSSWWSTPSNWRAAGSGLGCADTRTERSPAVQLRFTSLGNAGVMDDAHALEKRIDPVKDRLADDLVDDDGRPPDPEVVDRAVDEAAAPYAEAPVQEFVPLLVEHEARDELRRQGLRRELDEADRGHAVETDEDNDPHESVHLTGHQGVAPRPD